MRNAECGRTGRRVPAPGIVYPMLLASILILGLAAAGVAELWSTQVQRDKEEELLFRLRQYRQAIAQFRADHNRLPRELTDLLEDRSRLQLRRYLRRLYPDPITGKPDWEVKTVTDRTGQVSGITDLNSRSTGTPLKSLPDKAAGSYRDW